MTEGYTITKEFDAPIGLVWDMFVTPEHFSYWWGGNTVQVPLDTVEMDVRPGGSWKATMVGPDNQWSINWIGEYREVVSPTRLVMTLTDQADNPARDYFEIDLEEIANGTKVTLSQRGGNLNAEQYLQAQAGTDAFLETLRERLVEVQA